MHTKFIIFNPNKHYKLGCSVNNHAYRHTFINCAAYTKIKISCLCVYWTYVYYTQSHFVGNLNLLNEHSNASVVFLSTKNSFIFSNSPNINVTEKFKEYTLTQLHTILPTPISPPLKYVYIYTYVRHIYIYIMELKTYSRKCDVAEYK